MLRSDADALDAMMSPDLMFTTHTGQLIGKEDDLANHRSGRLRLNELEPSERRMLLKEDVAIVSVRMKVAGAYDGQSAAGEFRFTRVWTRTAGNVWQIVAAHATELV